MLMDEQAVIARFESPLNLLNRLKSSLTSRNSSVQIPSIPPTAESIVENLEDKIKAAGLKTKAANIMSSCLDELRTRIPEIQKAEKLASVAETMNKIVTAENKNKDDDRSREPQFVVYSPTFIKEDHFETIYVRE